MRVPGIPYVQGRNRYTDADGTKYGIAIHNTSNNATAAGEASYAQRRTDTVSSHFYVDGTQVIQSLDTRDRAGHAASKPGNEHAIAVEITGTNDKSRAWWLANVAWSELGRVLAVCCREYGIAVRRASVAEMKANPKVRAFYSHNDMRLAWGGTTHTDPGPNFPWDKLFAVVKAALDGEDDDMPSVDEIKAAILGDGGMQMLFTRVEALTSGRDPHTGKQPNVLHQRLVAIGNALAQVDGKVAAKLKAEFDEIDAAVAAARSEVADVDDQLFARLTDPSTPDEQVADALRQLLAGRPGVLALLAQS